MITSTAKMINYSIFVFCFVGLGHLSKCEKDAPPTLEIIQNYNIRTLEKDLELGWNQFCQADVDEGVIALFPGNNPSDSKISFIPSFSKPIHLPIKDISKISEFGWNHQLKTVIYVNAFIANQTYDMLGSLKYMQEKRRDYNIIIVDFAQDVIQLYNSVRHNLFVQGYFISKLLSTLALYGVKPNDVILVGHSVGANIAGLGADIHNQLEEGSKVSTLIAIDPARMCHHQDFYVNPEICDKVIVIHGENDVFSTSKCVGSIDVYPNGNELKYQPGCNSKICNHIYPFLLFVDAVIGKNPIMAVKCESWADFQKGKCDFTSVLTLGFDFRNVTSGNYYCMTSASQPFGLGEEGLKYRSRLPKRLRTSSQSLQ